jgi:hypothetical protein
MKNLLLALTFTLVLIACKSDNPKPAMEIEGIVGSWKYVATEKIVNEIPTWVAVNGEPNVTFRQDGVIIDSRLGVPNCCAPKAYTVNGLWFKIKNETAQEISEQCGLVDCVGCPTWNITQTGDELIVLSGCEPRIIVSKYIRE